MVKKNYTIRKIILALGIAAKKSSPIKHEKEKISKDDIDKRRAVRQKKIEKQKFSEKLRLRIQYVHLLKAKVELLERDYLRLKKSKKYKKSELNKIENKIKKLKDRLKDL